MIFDTHAHYDDAAFDGDREELLARLPEAGIGTVVNVSSDPDTVRSTLALAERYPFVYAAVGVHPAETAELDDGQADWLEEMCARPGVVAVGEIGLDYHWDEPGRERQKYWFRRQLRMARGAHLPVVVHSREAARDTLDILREEKAAEEGGVIHCFSYGAEMAREFLDLGFYLGIGGVLTFKNARKLKEAAAFAPLERIVLETDSPYLAPAPFRGQRNSSLNLPYIVKALSEIKGVAEEKVIAVTEENARRLYRLNG